MTIVSDDRHPGNSEPPCCSAAEPEPCQSCLTADDLESIVRFGHTGDEPVEPSRLAAPLTPEQLEELADRLELKYMRRDRPERRAGVPDWLSLEPVPVALPFVRQSPGRGRPVPPRVLPVLGRAR